jgi:hypothetical protein
LWIQDPAMTNDQTVPQIDAARESYFARSTDRPKGRIITRSRKTDEVVKAESRMRTAAWRSQNDGRKRPEAYHCSMQFLASMLHIVRQSGHEGLEDFRETEKAFQHALDTLEQRGFDKDQAKTVFKRLTRRVR